MKTWFERLAARERVLVIAGALVLVWLVFYLSVWSPVFKHNTVLRRAIADQQDTLTWMRQSAARIVALRRAAGTDAGGGLGGRSLLAVVDESARTGGLGGALKRIEPDTDKGVKVWLEGASFDQMILWLGTLGRQYQVEVSSGTIEPQGAGLVNVRLSLQESAA